MLLVAYRFWYAQKLKTAALNVQKCISCSHVSLSLFNYKISYAPYNIVHIPISKF
jgi:hypothetical protein